MKFSELFRDYKSYGSNPVDISADLPDLKSDPDVITDNFWSRPVASRPTYAEVELMSYEELMAADSDTKHGYALTIFEHLLNVEITTNLWINLSRFHATRLVVTGGYVEGLGCRKRQSLVLKNCFLQPGVVDQTTNSKYVVLIHVRGYTNFAESDRASDYMRFISENSCSVSLNIGKHADITTSGNVTLSGPAGGRMINIICNSVYFSPALTAQSEQMLLQGVIVSPLCTLPANITMLTRLVYDTPVSVDPDRTEYPTDVGYVMRTIDSDNDDDNSRDY